MFTSSNNIKSLKSTKRTTRNQMLDEVEQELLAQRRKDNRPARVSNKRNWKEIL